MEGDAKAPTDFGTPQGREDSTAENSGSRSLLGKRAPIEPLSNPVVQDEFRGLYEDPPAIQKKIDRLLRLDPIDTVNYCIPQSTTPRDQESIASPLQSPTFQASNSHVDNPDHQNPQIVAHPASNPYASYQGQHYSDPNYYQQVSPQYYQQPYGQQYGYGQQAYFSRDQVNVGASTTGHMYGYAASPAYMPRPTGLNPFLANVQRPAAPFLTIQPPPPPYPRPQGVQASLSSAPRHPVSRPEGYCHPSQGHYSPGQRHSSSPYQPGPPLHQQQAYYQYQPYYDQRQHYDYHHQNTYPPVHQQQPFSKPPSNYNRRQPNKNVVSSESLKLMHHVGYVIDPLESPEDEVAASKEMRKVAESFGAVGADKNTIKMFQTAVEIWAANRNISVRFEVYGSHLLGSDIEGSDVDCMILIASEKSTQIEELYSVAAFLKDYPDVSNAYVIESQYPIVKACFKEMHFDISICINAKMDEIRLEDPDLDKNETFRSMSQNEKILINGARNMHQILKSLAHAEDTSENKRLERRTENFRSLLRIVKIWARNNYVNSSKMGYLGGISLSILCAKLCQLFPNKSLSRLLEKFFWIFGIKWYKKENYVVLTPLQNPEAFSKKNDFSPFKIITPCSPQINSSHMIYLSSLQYLRSLMAKAHQQINALLQNQKPEIYSDFLKILNVGGCGLWNDVESRGGFPYYIKVISSIDISRPLVDPVDLKPSEVLEDGEKCDNQLCDIDTTNDSMNSDPNRVISSEKKGEPIIEEPFAEEEAKVDLKQDLDHVEKIQGFVPKEEKETSEAGAKNELSMLWKGWVESKIRKLGHILESNSESIIAAIMGQTWEYKHTPVTRKTSIDQQQEAATATKKLQNTHNARVFFIGITHMEKHQDKKKFMKENEKKELPSQIVLQEKVNKAVEKFKSSFCKDQILGRFASLKGKDIKALLDEELLHLSVTLVENRDITNALTELEDSTGRDPSPEMNSFGSSHSVDHTVEHSSLTETKQVSLPLGSSTNPSFL